MSATLHTVRRSIWAISITAVTVVGAWYGAGLKMQQDHRKAVEKRHENTPTELIQQLETQRGALVAKRLGLEKKLHELEMRNQGATREESKKGLERKR